MLALLLLWGPIIIAALIAGAIIARAVLANPRGEVDAGLAFLAVRVYARLMHRLRVEGREHIPRWGRTDMPPTRPGPLVVVANHISGVDPILLQAAVPFEITWLMLREMMPRQLDWFWSFAGVIPVAPGDGRAAREAIRVLKLGGVVGIFPEGGIQRPQGIVMPFEPGVGLIIHRAKAPVLQAVITGPPEVRTAYLSLLRPSRSCVRFLPLKDYATLGLGPAEIARDLEQRQTEAGKAR